MESYQAILKNYFPKDRARFHLSCRNALSGPREAILHATVRKTMVYAFYCWT